MNSSNSKPGRLTTEELVRRYELIERCRERIASGEARRLRGLANLRQRDIAEQLGCAISTVCGYEAGKSNPRGDLGVAYAELLDRLHGEYGDR